jgi:hypothetical protein
MLAAAGFKMLPADTPERQAQLAILPPHQLLVQHLNAAGNDTDGYVYADRDFCHCLYVGNANAFQAFQQMAFQKRLADERLQAAEMEENAAFNWSMWAPGDWGPGPVVVVHERGRLPRR